MNSGSDRIKVNYNELSGQQDWSVKMADSVLQRHPQLAEKWNYEFGLMLKGIEEVWKKTKNVKYLDYIKRNIDQFVDSSGNIMTYKIDEFNIDQVNAGKVLLFLYEQTGQEKYKTASDLIREQLKKHPRTSEGGFWHKQIYPHQMWLDGLYMGAPFYAEFAKRFNEPEIFDDVVNQLIFVEKHTKDPKTGLLYHGWDESKTQRWANPETGASPNFWGRAMGWYVMAIVDVLDYLPENHSKRGTILTIFKNVIAALSAVQDDITGLWYQVLDQGDKKANYLEASGSSMFVYAIAKGIQKGYLDQKYKSLVQKAYAGIIQNFIEVDCNGAVNLNQVCSVAGLGQYSTDYPYRDGSFEYYIQEPIVSNDYKGVGPFMLACVVMEKGFK